MLDHSSSNSRMLKNTGYLYVPMLLSMVVGLYTSRIILEVLGVKDYGIYNIVGGFVSMLSILTATITSAAQRFITYALGTGDNENLRKTFSTFNTLYIIAAILIFAIGEFFGLLFLDSILSIPVERINAAYFVYHCSLLTFSINLVAIPYNACIIAHERMGFFALTRVCQTTANLLIVYCVTIFPFDYLKTYAALVCLVGVLVRIAYSVYCKKYFNETRGNLSFDKAILKEVFSYSFWVTIGASSTVLKTQGVNIVINRFWGVAMNAANGISIQVNAVIRQFSSNVGTAITPQITKSYAAGEFQRALKLTYLLVKVQALLLIIISIPLIVEMDYVLTLWLKEPPFYAVTFTRFILVFSIANAMNSSLDPILLASGKVKWAQIFGGGLLLMNVPISWVVLKLGFAPVSTTIVAICIELVVMTTVGFIMKKIVSFPILEYLRRAILPIIMVGLLSSVVPSLIHYYIPSSFFRLCIVTIVSVSISLLLSYYIALTKFERRKVIDIINVKVMHKKRIDNDTTI